MNRAQLKLAVLEVIKRKKEVLFAPFPNNAVTKSEKETAWREVLAKAQSVGIAKSKHNWTYARDALFGNWKSRTLAKRHNARKTGTDASKAATLDEVDEMILDIMGTESPIPNGSVLPETSGDPKLAAQAEHKGQTRPRKCAKKRRHHSEFYDESEMNHLKKDLLRVEIYKNTLKVLKLETDLGLQPSGYTTYLQTANSTNNQQDLSTRDVKERVLPSNEY